MGREDDPSTQVMRIPSKGQDTQAVNFGRQSVRVSWAQFSKLPKMIFGKS